MSSDTPEEAARKAAERAKRMAAFSSKAIDEEDAPVAVRSFNQAREGADAGKVYSPKTGKVEEGTVSALPRKAGRGPSKIDDDELLAEIDAAVDAAASDQPKLPDLNDDADDDLLAEIDAAVNAAKTAPSQPPAAPAGMNAKRLAAMAAAAGDRSTVDTPPPAGISGAPKLPKGLAMFSSGGEEAPVFLAEKRAKPKGPTNLFEDDLTGLRPVDGVKPSSARANTPAPRHSAEDDEDLLAEIDAAVEAAGQEGLQGNSANGLKSGDDSWDNVADEGRKKGQPAYSGPGITSPGDAGGFEAKVDRRAGSAPKTAPHVDDEFAVQRHEARHDRAKSAPAVADAGMKFAAKPSGASGADDFAPGKFEAKMDREHREPTKPLPHVDLGKFEAKMDREERDHIKIRNPSESESFRVAMDQSSGELAKNAADATPSPAPSIKFGKEAHKAVPALRNSGDQAFSATRDATPKPLPKMHSPGDEKIHARQDAEAKALPKMHSVGDDAVNARQDRDVRTAPKIHSPGEVRPDVKQDREHRDAPKFKGFNDAPVEAKLDREHRAAPKIVSPADAERYAVNLDRAARQTPMPRMANPAEAAFETKQDAERKALPKMRSSADADAFVTKQDAQSHAGPKLRNAADSQSFETKQDAERKALPNMRSSADVDKYETKQDAQRKALPAMHSSADVDKYETKQDAQRTALPAMRSSADVDKYETKQDAQRKALPQMRNSADVDQYEAHFSKESRGGIPKMRNATDDAPIASKQDREVREKVDVFNPGQTEFDVKYEHESVWTTKPKRDVDESGEGKRTKKSS